MDENGKQLPNYHPHCLSGSSQTPLINSNGDNISERSTPISAHSLPFQSPTKLIHNPFNPGTPLVSKSTPVTTRVTTEGCIFFPAPPQTRKNSNGSNNINNLTNSQMHATNNIENDNNIIHHEVMKNEDTYHLYHEPLDPDEQEDIQQQPIINSPLHGINTTKSISAKINERAGHSRRGDVSNDIYNSYVSLKSTDRTNHRSRSYHGPKNSNLHNDIQKFSQASDDTKNLSTSVANLPPSPKAFNQSMASLQFRDHCVRELVETEKNYVHALAMIINRFAKPLEKNLTKHDNSLIFGDIKFFHQIHEYFLRDLERATFRSHSSSSSCNNNQTSSNPTSPTLINGSPLSSPLNQEHASLSPAAFSNSGLPLNNNSTKIARCFINIKDKFLKYGEYCANLSKAQAVLDNLSTKNELIASILNDCQQKANEGKFKLRDLLSLPMQRILKYHLLLAQLIKNTNSSSEDLPILRKAHEAMVDLGQYINEVKRDTEAAQIINEIEHSIQINMPDNTKLTDYGRLITDGFIKVSSPNDNKMKQVHDTKMKKERYVFIFDKVILICKVSGVRGYLYKEALVLCYLCKLDVNPTNQHNELSRHHTKEKWSYFFNLICTHNEETGHEDPNHNDRLVYTFYAKTQEMKNAWIDAIRKAMDNILPAPCRNKETNHDFTMHTFERASSCDACGKLLLGLYYQGYRCRVCFTSAHKKCLALTRPCGPALPPRPTNNTQHKPCEFNNSYANFALSDYPWFCGRMEREKAQTLLESAPTGTFLVRVSTKHGSFAISLNHNNQVKHMRIYGGDENQFYLSQNRRFNSIIELVTWYEKNSLVECFHMLNARLAYPFKAS